MRRRLNRREPFEDEVPNAMLGVSNLADVMLVLAVGIMLALVINWHISVGGGEVTQVDEDQLQEVDASEYETAPSDLEEADENPDLEMRGTVYIDKNTGKMYLIEEGQEPGGGVEIGTLDEGMDTSEDEFLDDEFSDDEFSDDEFSDDEFSDDAISYDESMDGEDWEE